MDWMAFVFLFWLAMFAMIVYRLHRRIEKLEMEIERREAA